MTKPVVITALLVAIVAIITFGVLDHVREVNRTTEAERLVAIIKIRDTRIDSMERYSHRITEELKLVEKWLRTTEDMYDKLYKKTKIQDGEFERLKKSRPVRYSDPALDSLLPKLYPY